jgi:putative sterol carrier protein
VDRSRSTAKEQQRMATYQFLSEEWLDEARSIRAEFDGKGAISHAIRMNLVIGEVPFGDGIVDAHVDTTSGELVLDTGHIDLVDLTVSLDYDVAKAILVEGNPQAGMQAFMSGKIKVEGDIAKLMALQSMPPDPVASEIAARILAMTD